MEQRLLKMQGHRIDLHVYDNASDGLRWLRQVMPDENIHDAHNEMSRWSHKGRFDLIYLVAVDCVLPDEELVGMLAVLRDYLSAGGHLLVVSASFLDESVGRALLRSCKETGKWLLELVGLFDRGQFWGWLRTRSDYRKVMAAVGVGSVADGFIETQNQKTYWIKGVLSKRSS